MNRTSSAITVFLLILASFLVEGCNRDSDSTTAGLKSNIPTAQFLSQSDELFAHRDDLNNVKQGITLLKQVQDADRRNYEAAWKLSRFYLYLGRYSKDNKESEQAFKDGIEAGRIATRVEPEKPDGYFWLGANLGENGKRNVLSGAASLSEIKQSMEKVIALDPSYEGASAYDILAQIELQSGIVGGTPEKAVEYLQKGIQIEKNNTNLYVHLGEALIKAKRSDEAKKQFEYTINMTPPAGHEFEHRELVEEAKKDLAENFK